MILRPPQCRPTGRFSTTSGARRWGAKLLLRIDHLTLSRIADKNKRWSKKRYNNAISVLRRAFAFGYRNHPEKPNPALGLKCCRMTRKDRPRPDPFRIQEAEQLILQI